MDISTKVQCNHDYGILKRVILCSPIYMRIEEIINETQRHFADENIDADIAVMQHNSLISILRKNNIEVVLLTSKEKYPEQVFTRDIGFVIGDIFFVCNMATDIRNEETAVLKEWLNSNDIPFVQLQKGFIEGGDVLIGKDTVWVGISDRTSDSAVDELAERCINFKVNALHFEEKYLHLDCVFNVISEDEALIFPPAFRKDDLDKLSACYRLIEITEKEQFTLAANVLSLGNRKLLSSAVNINANMKLRKQGYEVIEVDISEILKSGGSFRCITLPILRI